MSEQTISEQMIDVVLGMTESSRQNNENIQKAVETLEREKNALGAFRSDIKAEAGRVVASELRNAIQEQNRALETHFQRLESVSSQIYRLKRDLNWQNALFYFGGLTLFAAIVFGGMFWLIPSMDEIHSRKAYLEAIEAQIERSDNLKRLQVSTCDKRLCVKVIDSKCNYGKKGEKYCVADLK